MQANRFLTLLVWAGCLLLHACTDEVDPASAGFSYVSGLPNPPQVNAESAESVKSYVSWLGNEENGYIKRRTIGSFWFEGLLEPPAYAVLLNHRGERVTNDLSLIHI